MTGETSEAADFGLPTRNLVEMLRQLGVRGITQAQVARRANVPPQYVSDVRHGRRPLTELFARRLEDEFGYNFLWLLGEEDTPERAALPAPPFSADRFWLPIVGEAIAGDPRVHPRWSGACMGICGTAAARAARAVRPYILQLGHGDREGRLRKGDCVLVSQAAAENAEVSVVSDGKKILLARRKAAKWLRVETGEPMRGECEVIGHIIGVVWSGLA